MAFDNASGTTYDLTNGKVNPMACQPHSVPTHGGTFILHNRIDFTNSIAPTITDAVANTLKILKVPKGTTITKLRFHAVRGKTAPTHAYAHKSGSALGASAGKSATMDVGSIVYKSASQSASSAVTTANTFMSVEAITKATGAVATLSPTAAASTPFTDYVTVDDTTAATAPYTFQYGGFVTMGVTDSTGSSTSNINGAFTGVMDVVAECYHLPE
ncbi:hypothetical protein Dalk_4555 [Desulfatibacillum aliphaticivorans]|uniref:Uncharacterized protein n=1 Tax=Desulfatibacillum aliphaticivorans TaxID=218208 RepID=B8FCS0_DESAL|nr:hypothetical protein [Desulfatibacillum aliphaticivorans]ACL06233.1 hypothetical protein Dalk_4555 [Desulfatibacillum aliphaticivorans]